MSAAEALQLPLDLGHRPAFDRADFLVAPSNETAVAMIDSWPDWQSHALILHGPAASGKSHLGAVWQARSRAVRLTPDALESADSFTSDSTDILLEGGDFAIGTRDGEAGLLHIYNMIRETGGSLLMTMRARPQALEFALPDLASRLRAVPAVAIEQPDEQLLAAIIVKMFHDRQLHIAAEVLNYILPRMERSFAAAHNLVEAVDKRALAEKRAITIPLVRQIMMEREP